MNELQGFLCSYDGFTVEIGTQDDGPRYVVRVKNPMGRVIVHHDASTVDCAIVGAVDAAIVFIEYRRAKMIRSFNGM